MKPSNVKEFEFSYVHIIYNEPGDINEKQFFGYMNRCNKKKNFVVVNNKEKRTILYADVDSIEKL